MAGRRRPSSISSATQMAELVLLEEEEEEDEMIPLKPPQVAAGQQQQQQQKDSMGRREEEEEGSMEEERMTRTRSKDQLKESKSPLRSHREATSPRLDLGNLLPPAKGKPKYEPSETLRPTSSRKKPLSRRDRKVEKLLRQADTHGAEMTITIEVIVPGGPDEGEAHQALPAYAAAAMNNTAVPISKTPSALAAVRSESTASPFGRRNSTTVSRHNSIVGGTASRASISPIAGYKSTNLSSYLHYEFEAPFDDRATKCDLVVHHNCAKHFVDADSKMARHQALQPHGYMYSRASHSYSVACNHAFISELHQEGLRFRIWDTKDRVASRARFDRPKQGRRASKIVGDEKVVQSGGERATDLQHKAHALFGKSRLTPLERRLKNEPPSNAASEDGTGAVIHVDMTDLIVGDLTTTTYLEDILDTGLQRLLAVKITVTMDKPLLSPEQRALLNPMVLTIKSCEQLPHKPIPYADLDQNCESTTVVFDLPGCHKTKRWPCRQPHGPTATWSRRCVILTGQINRADFAHWLQFDAGLRFEIHDRDRKELPAGTDGDQIFGQSADDQGATKGSTGFNDADAVGRRLETLVVDDKWRPWDPYGVAVADLSAMCRGARIMHASLPVLPCQERETLELTRRGNAAGRAMHPGHYVGSGTSLEITVELSYSRDFRQEISEEGLLVMSGAMDEASARKRVKKAQVSLRDGPTLSLASWNKAPVALVPFSSFGDVRSHSTSPTPVAAAPRPTRQQSRPFTRFVALFEPLYAPWAEGVRTQVHQVNLRSLDLVALDPADRDMALNTYELSEAENDDEAMDVITGIHLAFPDVHIVLLEGLHAGSLTQVVQAAGWPSDAPPSKFRTLFNSAVQVENRLYGGFGIGLPCMLLQSSLKQLLGRQEMYFQGHPLHGCLTGLTCLQQLTQTSRMADALRNSYFPPYESVCHIRRQLATDFGLSLLLPGQQQQNEKKDVGKKGRTSAALSRHSSRVSLRSSNESGRTTPRVCRSGRFARDAPSPSPGHVVKATASRRLRQPGVQVRKLQDEDVEAANAGRDPTQTTATEAAAKQRQQTRGTVGKEPKREPEFLRDTLRRTRPAAPHRIARLDDFEDTYDGTGVYNYSSQRLNASEATLRHLREGARTELGPRVQLSTSAEFLSGAFGLLDPAEERRVAELESRAKWRTQAGFDTTLTRAPAVQGAVTLNSEGGVDAVDEEALYARGLLPREPYVDSLANRATLKFDRGTLPWDERNATIRVRPLERDTFGPDAGLAVHYQAEEEKRRIAKDEMKRWRSRLVVEDEHIHIHRTPYENRDRVPDLDRAQSLLKDAPKRAVYRAAQRLQTGGLSLQAGLSYEHEQHGPMTLSSDGVARRGGIPLNTKLRPE